MDVENRIEKIKGYCAQCSCWCPTVAHIRDGVFTEVTADTEHPLACGICPKALAGPELVYSNQRLQYPLRRTNPKSDPEPVWERISWDEALGIIADRLNGIKAEYGPEAVAFARSGPAGSPMSEIDPWVTRLCNLFGSPNNIATGHICQWHRDYGSAYTYGNIGKIGSLGRAEFERSSCILIWGNNIHDTRHSLLPLIQAGIKRGARLIVVDPRKTDIAAMADLWLQVHPGTDGALALTMLNVMLEEKLYDNEFVRDWTTAPFLVRSDTGKLLRAGDLVQGGNPSQYVLLDATSDKPQEYIPGQKLAFTPVLDAKRKVRLAGGKEIECQTVFRSLQESVSRYALDRVEELTGISADKVRDATRMLATTKPACWYSWNGIEQSINATQTNRALCMLYALTGNYDVPGGNVLLARLPMNPIDARTSLSPEVEQKRLGFAKRPLGAGGPSRGLTQAYEVYEAILHGKPYPVRAMVGFGGNVILSNAPSTLAKEAIAQLDFHVQVELFLTPTAELADIVLPAASSWESWHVGVNIGSLGQQAHVQLRPAVISPQYESRPDMEVIFQLAKALGLGDKFWDGDVEAGVNHQFAPAKITVEMLKANPGGISVNLPMEYRKYRKEDSSGNYSGLPTPSKRVELYSEIFKEYGHEPLPVWTEPLLARFQKSALAKKYPLTLTCGKIIEYCHSQHRALPSLRKRVPHPFLEINPVKAKELGVEDGDWIVLATPHGSITLKAKLTERILYDVVSTQNGWWQSCSELNLPGYDPYTSAGANVNLLYRAEEMDLISGSLPLKGYPCNVRKLSPG